MNRPVSTAGLTDRVEGYRFGMRCRVDLSDTDLGAVVYYARYPHYLDRGVIEYRRHLGIPPLGPDGHLFVVASLAVDYRSSARFDDEVEVLVRVPEIRRSSHLVEARMERLDAEGATLLAEMRCTIVGVSTYEAGGRPSRVPEEMRAAIDGFEGR